MKKKTPKTIFEIKNISEEEFLIAIDNVTKKLVYKFKFGYHSILDMKQQAIVFAMEGLKNYDPAKPLENFLWTHIRNRLFNFKRDNYHRPNDICLTCPFFDPKLEFSNNKCKKFQNKHDCELYDSFEKQNTAKKNLKNPPTTEENYNRQDKDKILSSIINKEILSIIENNISLKYKEDYLKLKNGSKISKKNKEKLRQHLFKILQEFKTNE